MGREFHCYSCEWLSSERNPFFISYKIWGLLTNCLEVVVELQMSNSPLVEIHILKRAEIFVLLSLHSHSPLITDGLNISPFNVEVNVTLNESLNDNHQMMKHNSSVIRPSMLQSQVFDDRHRDSN